MLTDTRLVAVLLAYELLATVLAAVLTSMKLATMLAAVRASVLTDLNGLTYKARIRYDAKHLFASDLTILLMR